MKQEDKELLLKDLCARLPYGVKMSQPDGNLMGIYTSYSNGGPNKNIVDLVLETSYAGNNLPYLRPMSSITDEEKEELKYISAKYIDEWENTKTAEEKWALGAKTSYIRAEFYYSHHLDWNGLIDKGLALEALDGMYNIKNRNL